MYRHYVRGFLSQRIVNINVYKLQILLKLVNLSEYEYKIEDANFVLMTTQNPTRNLVEEMKTKPVI